MGTREEEDTIQGSRGISPPTRGGFSLSSKTPREWVSMCTSLSVKSQGNGPSKSSIN